MVVPEVLGVNPTEHEPKVRVQLLESKLPEAPSELNVTVPTGVIAVPDEESVTLVVQVEVWLTTTGVVHDTAVADSLLLTSMETVALLGPWVGTEVSSPS